jgi:RNA polymerase sigma factor (sigma-70 family)
MPESHAAGAKKSPETGCSSKSTWIALLHQPRALRLACEIGLTMSIGDESKTSPTLLGRLAACPPDQAAWNQFVDCYGPRILQWCRAWGLQEADMMDVSQSVLAKLAVQLRSFRYDPARSFRGWLRSVVRNAARDATAAGLKLAGAGGTDTVLRLASAPARDDLVRRLEEEFDLELLDTASAAVRSRVSAKSWDAYELTAGEEQSAVTVAATLGMSVGAVYQAKSRIMQMIQDEVQRLGSDLAEEGVRED